MAKCNKCFKDKVSLFGTGRSEWCPDCESDSKTKDEWVQGDGFKMKDAPKKKIDLEIEIEDLFSDEITQPIDLKYYGGI